MNSHTINVYNDFSKTTYGRYLKDDPDRSGEAFRDKTLIPALEKYDLIIVDISNYEHGSSFLEEVFGGLVRKGYDKAVLDKKLKIIHTQYPSMAIEAKGYIGKI